ncbi:MAG: L-histidine N(alpha)-methyltransferase [Balneolales bacterium]
MPNTLNTKLPANLSLYEYPVEEEDFKAQVLKGLTMPRKELSPTFFYDNRGSQLFEEITRLDEYYLTHTEFKIFDQHAKDIRAETAGQKVIVEPGSGNSEKISILLERMRDFTCYIPIEISRNHLLENSLVLAEKFPEINIVAVASDYMNPKLNLKALVPDYQNPLIFFPGSSIGNYGPVQAVGVLKQFTKLMGGGGKLLIGVDLKKDKVILENAYNDDKGLTASFNLNALHHIKRELDIEDLNPDSFGHVAWYNDALGRVEMHLVSVTEQEYELDGTRIHFNRGETIHTENSYKYTIAEFQDLASKAGLVRQRYWTDAQEYYSVQLFGYG